MIQFSVFDRTTGAALRTGTCALDDLELQATHSAEIILPGACDLYTRYLDTTSMTIVARAAKPSAYHVWDQVRKTWVTDFDAAWAAVRTERNRLIAASDWATLPDVPLSHGQREDWLAYRQALRDITLQSNPLGIAWPSPPQR